MNTSSECEQVRIASMALFDGESAPLDRDAVETHLQTCDACREAITRLDIENLFPASARLAAQSNDIWMNLQQRLEEEESSMNDASTISNVRANPWTTQQRRVASLALAACVLIVIGLWVSNGFQGSGSPVGPIAVGPERETKTVKQKDFHSKELTRYTLEDGTVVVAQPGSKHRIEGPRRIRLEQGSL
jgi:predicted anti-sigma-YlaC factor YlaD